MKENPHSPAPGSRLLNFLNFTHFIPAGISLIIVLLCYSAYFYYDDFYFLNKVRNGHFSWINCFSVWETGLWRPLFLSWFYFLHLIFDRTAEGFHLTNGILYIITVILYQRTCFIITKSQSISFLAAILFASAYNHWEAVFWISTSSDLWVGMLCLLLWNSLSGIPNTIPVKSLFLPVLYHLLALLSKENACILFPLTLMFLIFMEKKYILRSITFYIFFGLPWISSILWHLYIGSQGNAMQSGVYALNGLHIISNIGFMTFRLFFPWIVSPTWLQSIITLLYLSGFIAFLLYKKKYLPLFALGWMIVGLVPNNLIHLPNYYPSRYLYVSSMGWALLLSLYIKPFLTRDRYSKVITLCLIFLYCSCNLYLYDFGSDINSYRKYDSFHRLLVAQIKVLHLPYLETLAILGLENDLKHLPLDSFYLIYAVGIDHAPPKKIYLNNNNWATPPEGILEWQNGSFTIKYLKEFPKQ